MLETQKFFQIQRKREIFKRKFEIIIAKILHYIFEVMIFNKVP